MDRFCCGKLHEAITALCKEHSDPWECSDYTLVYFPGRKVVGIPVRDGGRSFIKIDYCPWCGDRLKTQMKRWNL